MIELIGFSASALTTGCGLPQVIKTIMTGKANDVSLVMFICAAAGAAFWVIYGYLIGSYALVIGDSVAFVICVVEIGFILRSRKRRDTDNG